MTDHAQWDELAAGHALDALEPDDEERFAAHLTGCDECATTLGDFTLVAAQLGSLAEGGPEAPPSWQQVRAGIIGSSAHVTDLGTARRRRATHLLAAAAVIVMLAGGGVAGWQLAGHGSGRGRASTVALASCRQLVGCREIKLHTASGASPAVVTVNADRATVVPLSLAAAPAGRIYVLWQMPRDGSPIPVSEFRDTTRQTAAVPLPSRYDDTAAFAISVESAAVTPSRPTHVLAVGNTT